MEFQYVEKLTEEYSKLSLEIQDILKEILFFIKNVDKVEFYNLNLQMDVVFLNLSISKEILEHIDFLNNCINDQINYKLYIFYDYFMYKSRVLREKYEDIDQCHLTLDEENFFLEILKNLINTKSVKVNQLSIIFLKIYLYWLRRLKVKIELIINKQLTLEKFKKTRHRVTILTKSMYKYLVGTNIKESLFRETQQNKDILKKIEYNCSPRQTGFNYYVNMLVQVNSSMKSFFSFANDQLINWNMINQNKQVWQNFYDSLENSMFSSKSSQNVKYNEVVYIYDNYKETDFKLYTTKDLRRQSKDCVISKYTQLRIITNKLVSINTNEQNLKAKKEEKPIRETNFFGLLLKFSKDYFTPTYDLVIHVHGGSYFNQTSDSHLFYLNDWAKQSDSVIISIDLKNSSESKISLSRKLSNILHLIFSFSEKLFNFNINNLVICGESIGTPLIFEALKYNHMKISHKINLLLLCPVLNAECLKDEEKIIDNIDIDYNVEYESDLKTDSTDINIENLNSCMILSALNDPFRSHSQRLSDSLKNVCDNVHLITSLFYYFGYPSVSLNANKLTLFIPEGIKYLRSCFVLGKQLKNVGSTESISTYSSYN